jgi:hypothetical protein
MDISTKLTESILKLKTMLIIRYAGGVADIYYNRDTAGKMQLQNSVRERYVDTCITENSLLSVNSFLEIQTDSPTPLFNRFDGD